LCRRCAGEVEAAWRRFLFDETQLDELDTRPERALRRRDDIERNRVKRRDRTGYAAPHGVLWSAPSDREHSLSSRTFIPLTFLR